MSTEEKFKQALADVKTLPNQPPDVLLQFYSLYKQATDGDVKGKRPGMLDFKGRAKYDAWAERKGTDKTAAMEQYIGLYEKLKGG